MHGLTPTSHPNIFTMVTIVDTNWTVITVYQPRFTSKAAEIVQINTTGCSTIVPICANCRICKRYLLSKWRMTKAQIQIVEVLQPYIQFCLQLDCVYINYFNSPFIQDKQMNYFSKNSYIQNTWMLDSISAYKTIVGVENKELLPNKKLLLFITLAIALPALLRTNWW